jgi:2-polyprenyl-3-methyl-5-hydroxy-6-metoxy-1,4-benzoquinol methylase
MSFEDLMSTVNRWLVATEALAAVGAELNVGESGHPEMVDALHAVSAAAGLGDLDQLAPPQRAMVTGLIRMFLRQAQDLVDDPGRAPGWSVTDPDILAGWGRGSMVVPTVLAALPELASVGSFLDVGTGVGLLAVAAARTWPQATITGIDVWPPSLQAATANVAEAGLADRITIREQSVVEVDDQDAYDCVWFPTFFVTEPTLAAATPRLVRSLRPGGWLVLGRMITPPDPLAEAVNALRIIRSGGADFDAKQLSGALEQGGCTGVRVVPPQRPAPMEYVIGQRPA